MKFLYMEFVTDHMNTATNHGFVFISTFKIQTQAFILDLNCSILT